MNIEVGGLLIRLSWVRSPHTLPKYKRRLAEM